MPCLPRNPGLCQPLSTYLRNSESRHADQSLGGRSMTVASEVIGAGALLGVLGFAARPELRRHDVLGLYWGQRL